MTAAVSNESRIEAVRERLYALAQASGALKCYLLMQTADLPDELDDHLQQAMSAAGIEPAQAKIAQLPARYWPVLVTLNLREGLHSAVSAQAVSLAMADTEPQSLRRGKVQRTCAWIFSDMSIDEVARHIATTAVAHHPASHKNRWVRYYDPMVADLFWRACTPGQHLHFLRGIAHWAYIDRWQQLQLVQPSRIGEGPVSPLTVPVWERLQGVGALNQAWLRARSEGLEIEPDRLWRAAASLQQGYRSGLRKHVDLDLFAWQAIQLGPDFYRHDKVQALLKQASEGHDYGELAHQLDDAQWHRIGLEAGTTRAQSAQERESP